jgi:TolB protein
MVGALAALCVLPATSVAAFPGENGLIAFSVSSPGNDIATMEPDGGDVTLLTHNPSGGDPYDSEPTWAPNGEQLAFVRAEASGKRIWVMNANGTNAHAVSAGPSDSDPAWSPEGRQLVFTTDGGTGHQQLAIVNANGTGFRQLGSPGISSGDPAWSPDGSLIAFVQETPTTSANDIYTIRPDGSDLHNVTNNPRHLSCGTLSEATEPNWSPDSQELIYSGNETVCGNPVVMEIKPDGSDRQQLGSENPPGPNHFGQLHPVWSPDGRYIAFENPESKSGQITDQIYVMNADGSDIHQITSAAGYNGDPSWQPIVSPTSTAPCATGGFASGSPLQAQPQEGVWLTDWGWAEDLGVCGALPTVTYTPTSSEDALDEFGNNNGALNPSQDGVAAKSGSSYTDAAGRVLDWYVGSEMPPTQGQLDNAQIASGDRKGLLEEVTIPVAQAPVAVLLSLPVNCALNPGSKVLMSSAMLVKLWEDRYKSWTELLAALPKSSIEEEELRGCGVPIKLQAQSTASGVSYALKDYLAQTSDQLAYDNETMQFATGNIWSGYVSDQPIWPDPVEDGASSNEESASLVRKTAREPGSVGYASAADAVNFQNGGFTEAATPSTFEGSQQHQIVYAELQDNTGQVAKEPSTTPAYSNPVAESPHLEEKSKVLWEEDRGNCQTTTAVRTDAKPPYSYLDSWYGISASEPNIGETVPGAYPLCALTYDLIWHHYSAASLFGEGEQAGAVAASVKSLFEYITGPIGQAAVDHEDYDSILTTSAWAAHVKLAVNQITE